MLENPNPRDHQSELGREKEREAPAPRPLADREVPLGKRRTPAAVQSWLDGELPEAAVRRGDMVRDVDFWRRLNVEVEERRQMRTPVHVYEQIMKSLPQTTPRIITPWWRRPFEMTPAMALLLGAGLLAAGLAVGFAVISAR
ncbi:MAG TPA: hypothetical protein VJ596_05310 [Gemmatimonadaceae bacterium]|nr:hypothetical protein [Gemmatimonadaceae bacterium]